MHLLGQMLAVEPLALVAGFVGRKIDQPITDVFAIRALGSEQIQKRVLGLDMNDGFQFFCRISGRGAIDQIFCRFHQISVL